MTLSRIRLNISGYVQGVGFRFFVIDKARAIGLKGMVRNINNGSVEVVAEGEKSLLDQFSDILRNGPSAATVSNVNVAYENFLGEFTDFTIKG